MANLTPTLSDIAIANMAATTLDDAHINSFDDPGNLARFLSREYGFVRDELLASHPWVFARSRIVLAPDPTPPAFGWTYRYALPADCLRVLPLTADGTLNGDLIPYEREGDYILTDEASALRVRYIVRIIDASKFDPLFARALGQRLGWMAAQRITGKAGYGDKARQMYALALEDAYHRNALEWGTTEDYAGQDVLTIRGVGLSGGLSG